MEMIVIDPTDEYINYTGEGEHSTPACIYTGLIEYTRTALPITVPTPVGQ